MIYLGQPYTHTNPEVVAYRVEMGAALAAVLMEMGEVVFAPIPHTAPIAALMDPETSASHPFWMRQDLPHLAHCQSLYVLCLDGWASSKGLREEIDFAEEWGIPVQYVTPDRPIFREALARVQRKAVA